MELYRTYQRKTDECDREIESQLCSFEDFNSYFLQALDGVLYGQLDEGNLFAVNVGDGSFLPWGFEIGGNPDVLHYVVSDGVVYSAGLQNSVYAHTVPAPR